MTLAISPKYITRILVLTVLFLFFASLTAQITLVLWGAGGHVAVLQLFDVSRESSVPTWYSSAALLLCAVLLAAIAVLRKHSGGRYVPHWSILSVVFLYLSVDEVALIHETLGNNVGRFLVANYMSFIPRSFIRYTWVVPYGILVLLGLLAFLKFFFHLPRRTLLLFLAAGAIFVAGALGMEMLESQHTISLTAAGLDMRYPASWPADAQVYFYVSRSIEEGLEMLGIVVFIHALLSYISFYVESVAAVVRLGNVSER